MKTLRLLVILISSVLLIACDDYLNVTPTNAVSTSNFYSTKAEIDQALTGVYNGLLPIAYHTMCMSELRSDNTWTLIDSKQNNYNEIAHYNTTAMIGNSEVENAWGDYYTIVARANALLDNIDNVKYETDSIKKEYIAEARFLRAFAYFDLVRYFGRIPASTHTLTQKEAFRLAQSEPESIYQNIIVPDLRYASENMEYTPLDFNGTAKVGRASKMAAMSLLGKVYLTMAGFPLNQTEKKDSAAYYLGKVIDYANSTGKYWASNITKWNEMWLHENDNKYFIFEVQYACADGMGNTMTPFAVGSASSEYCSSGLVRGGHSTKVEANMRIHFQQKDSITKKYIDKRCWGTISSGDLGSEDSTVESTDPGYIKFFENRVKRSNLGYSDMDGEITSYTYWPQNFPILRLEDVMLMYAEIVGNTEKGREMVNKIRLRAGETAVDASCPADSFQTIVENERRYELAFEGIRWHDLVRKNKYVDAIKNKFISDDNTSDKQYASFAERVNKTSYLFPIPQSQIDDTNGLYEQNPGYK